MSKVPYVGLRDPSKNDYQLNRTVNGNLEYGSNIKSTTPVQIISPANANQEFEIYHNLGYVPNGIHVLSKDQSADVYSSRQSQWTTSQIYLKCTQPSVNLTLVVI